MGRKQHQSDRMFVTNKEWRGMGGHESQQQQPQPVQSLPFDHCAITLRPFTAPVCDRHGNVFDLSAVMPVIQRTRKNPLTGEPLAFRDLITLNFAKSGAHYIDPITLKPLTANTVIVTIKTSGNVYDRDTIEQLNVREKCMEDLMTGEPFTKQDIIVLQDPTKVKVIQRISGSVSDDDSESEEESTGSGGEHGGALAVSKPVLASVPFQSLASHSSPSASATATLDDSSRESMYTSFRSQAGESKGYVRLVTNLGPINIELDCHRAPRTCHNFLTLCEQHYYDHTRCHRLIKGFMAQLGDPTGTGTGGAGAFSEQFSDEFDRELKHSSRGVVSMANAGPNTNSSQFFLTFVPCPSLDDKHSVFGRVVGGAKTLDAIEAIETSESDTPLKAIVIESVHVFSNPFNDYQSSQPATADTDSDSQAQYEARERRQWFSNPAPAPSSTATTGGAISFDVNSASAALRKRSLPLSLPAARNTEVESLEKKPRATGLFDYSRW